MARIIKDLPNITTPAGIYPYGRIKDNPGDNTGTKMNEASFGDIFQFFSRMMANAGITSNNLADNNTNGYQLYEAFALLTQYVGTKTALTLTNSFVSGAGFGLSTPSYRISSLGLLYLSGGVIAPGGQSIFTNIPSLFRPQTERFFIVGSLNTTDLHRLSIKANGDTSLRNLDGTSLGGGVEVFIDCTISLWD